MNSKQLAKEFVLPYFNLRESLFNAAWDYVNANFEKVSEVLISDSSLTSEKTGIPLSFGGEEQRGAVKAIIIFADGFKEMPLEGDFSSLVDSIKSACGKYHAEEGLTKEILKKVSSLENRIEKFLKPQEKAKVLQDKSDVADYEIYISKDRGIGAESLEASKNRVEKIYLKNKEDYDIFVYTRSVYSKKKDFRVKKPSLVFIELDQRMYVLLVLFLKYKDSSLDVFALHKRAWEHVPKDYDGRPDYKKTMDYLKSAISELKAKVNVDALEIKKPRNSAGYICTGNFRFCVIIDKSQSGKYSLSDFDIKDED
jgi:hypothetical protein